MAVKEILFGKEGRDKVVKGVNTLAESVGSTLGYGGRTVLINKGDLLGTIATKDGVRVASEIKLLDRFEDMGVQIVYQAAKATANEAGDGTTTSTVIAQHLINLGSTFIEDLPQLNITEFQKGMKYALDTIIQKLEESSIKVEGDFNILKQIATISANGDENIGELVAKAVTSISSKDIIIDKNISKEDSFVKESGFRFDSGLYSHHFESSQGTSYAEYENAKVLIINGAFVDTRDILSIMKKCQENDKPLIIFAENVVQNTLTGLAHTHISGALKLAVIHLPDAGDLRKYSVNDLSVASGCKKIADKELNVPVNTLNYEDLGEISYIKSTLTSTIIVFKEEQDEVISELVKKIEKGYNESVENNDLVRVGHMKKRLDRFSDGVVKIYIHSDTDIEFEEKYDRVEDAVKAVLSALEEGVVKGGGVALFEAGSKVKLNLEMSLSFFNGVNTVVSACSSPISKILYNSGFSFEEVENLKQDIIDKEFKEIFNVRTLNFVDAFKEGIIYPLKVTKNAITNAVSASSTLLATDTFIINHNFEKSLHLS